MIPRTSEAPQSKSPPQGRIDLAELDLREIETALAARGEPAFHARQIYRWVYRRAQPDLEPERSHPRAQLLQLEGARHDPPRPGRA